jgi:hypothetical protein
MRLPRSISMQFVSGRATFAGRRSRRKVAAIFSEVLNAPSVGLDDFFRWVATAFTRQPADPATATFGQQFSRLHEDATVKDPLEWLSEAEDHADIYAPIVLIRIEGPAPLLFVVHGRRGQAHVGPHFLNLLGDDQPLYALQARGLDGKKSRMKPSRQWRRNMAASNGAARRSLTRRLLRRLLHYARNDSVAPPAGGEIFPLLIDPPAPNFTKQARDR